MLSISNIVTILVILWILVYLIVYYYALHQDSFDKVISSTKLKEEFNYVKGVILHKKINTNLRLNPFLSNLCVNFISDMTVPISIQSVAVVIVARNLEPSSLVHTVEVIIENSKSNSADHLSLTDILIIDDYSHDSIRGWEEWEDLLYSYKDLINIIREPAHHGVAKARNKASEILFEKYKETAEKVMVVFVEAPALVSEHWLWPLATSLTKYPKALVYPSIDLLVNKEETSNSAGAGHKKDFGGISHQQQFGVVKSDNMVTGFDWSLQTKWEPLAQNEHHNMDRLGSSILSGSSVGLFAKGKSNFYHEIDGEVLSPAIPDTFAVKLNYFKEIGGYDTKSISNTHTGVENIELALRTWLCGGLILKQSCSRVAQLHQNTFSDSSIEDGVTQGAVDKSVMNLANKWFWDSHTGKPADTLADGSSSLRRSPVASAILESQTQVFKYKEVIYQARFSHRIPYGVSTSVDPMPVTPPQGSGRVSKTYSNGMAVCLPIQWYLQEVYPGLLLDMEGVTSSFSRHINSEYFNTVTGKNGWKENDSDQKEKGLIDLVHQYTKNTDIQHVKSEIEMLKKRQEKFGIDINPALFKDGNTRVPYKHKFHAPPEFHPPDQNAIRKAKDQQRKQDHALHVRGDLACEDIPPSPYDPTDTCENKAKVGITQALGKSAESPEIYEKALKQWCAQNKFDIIFACPKLCGYCDVNDGKFCEDFYLNKCPVWQKEGKCGQQDKEIGVFNEVCRKSCNMCTPKYLAPPPAQEIPKLEVKNPVNNPEQLKDDIPPLNVDPFLLRKQFEAGLVFDEWEKNQNIPKVGGASDDPDACQIRGKPEGQMLSKFLIDGHDPTTIDISKKPEGVKIFCGFYTMEKNHLTNVAASRNTWAKKCDGFLAFSTVEDQFIPSVKVIHEGEESYDNMWQKSKSIWKFIHHHLKGKFDYYLMGGDDMFYIVENLRAYLNSQEIVKLRESSNGLFLGRVFQPPNQPIFNSGGAGYILDDKALNVLGRDLDIARCRPHQHGFWEDVNVAHCLASAPEKILPYDTRDPLERERFHPFTPGLHLTYRVPKNPDWYKKYNPNLKLGYECCSVESISFHYAPAHILNKLNNFFYHCNKKE